MINTLFRAILAVAVFQDSRIVAEIDDVCDELSAFGLMESEIDAALVSAMRDGLIMFEEGLLVVPR